MPPWHSLCSHCASCLCLLWPLPHFTKSLKEMHFIYVVLLLSSWTLPGTDVQYKPLIRERNYYRSIEKCCCKRRMQTVPHNSSYVCYFCLLGRPTVSCSQISWVWRRQWRHCIHLCPCSSLSQFGCLFHREASPDSPELGQISPPLNSRSTFHSIFNSLLAFLSPH